MLAGTVMLGATLWNAADPVRRMALWKHGTLTVATCRTYSPESFNIDAPDMAEMSGMLSTADGTQVVFHGYGLAYTRCPAEGEVLEVDYDPDDPQRAQRRATPVGLALPAAFAVAGVGLIGWGRLRPRSRKENPPQG